MKTKENKKRKKTYNTGDSLVVIDPTTSPALIGLSMGERTGSRVFQWVWSYVLELYATMAYVVPYFDHRTSQVEGDRVLTPGSGPPLLQTVS